MHTTDYVTDSPCTRAFMWQQAKSQNLWRDFNYHNTTPTHITSDRQELDILYYYIN